MSVTHIEHKNVVSERINTLAEQVYALKEAYDRESSLRIALLDKNNNRKKLSPSEVSRMRRLWKTRNWTQAALADAFDINPATVSRIVRGFYHK